MGVRDDAARRLMLAPTVDLSETPRAVGRVRMVRALRLRANRAPENAPNWPSNGPYLNQPAQARLTQPRNHRRWPR